jgi:methylthioribose-1-phosphate isomerase
MKVEGIDYRTIWCDENRNVHIIDQRREFLPHRFEIVGLSNVRDFCYAIKNMQVRGAGLIGATAGYGMFVGARELQPSFSITQTYSAEVFDSHMSEIGEKLKSTRPTAVNLSYAVDRQLAAIRLKQGLDEKVEVAFATAEDIANEDAEMCRNIGLNGVEIIKGIHHGKRDTVNILTHCNAGWLAFVDYGSATSPIYEAHRQGIPVHVWVDVTSPWNQGSRLTAWELANEGVDHSIISDNAGGYLMQEKMIDMVITGADRVTRTGDAANKIGTYLKALAARDNDVPFYVALPSSTFDFSMTDGRGIPIEMRDPEEVKYAWGSDSSKRVSRVLIANESSHALNPSFDVTPARLITGLITERGIISPVSEARILEMHPQR